MVLIAWRRVIFIFSHYRILTLMLMVGPPSLSQLPRVLPVFECIEKKLWRPGPCRCRPCQQIYLSQVQFRKIFKRITGTNRSALPCAGCDICLSMLAVDNPKHYRGERMGIRPDVMP